VTYPNRPDPRFIPLTMPYVPPGTGPQRPWWKKLTSAQQALIVGAAVLVLCYGGATVAGALSDGKPDATPAHTTSRTTTPVYTSATASSPAATAQPSASSPTVVKQTVTETEAIPYATQRVNDSTLAKGSTRVRTKGVKGVKTLTYEVTLVDGVQQSKQLVKQEVTTQPVTEVIAVGTKSTQQCDPNYTGACVPIASDVDCAGGSGNGPAYVQGPVYVVGNDIYDLDSDGDGVGCEK